MNESQRQFVMGVAGVRLWYARGPLPGAAPSPDFDFGEPEQPEAAVEGASVRAPTARAPRSVSDASRKGLARLQGLLAETGAGAGSEARKEATAVDGEVDGAGVAPVTRELPEVVPQASPEPDPVPVEQTDDALTGKVVGFHWRFWIGNQWLLVSTCPDTASGELEDRLATNILRALGDRITRTEALNWPVFNNPAVPGNDAAGAAEVVSAMAETINLPRQLWLGLEPDDSDPAASALWRNVSAPLGEATVSFPVSLVALSSDPVAKRTLWQALQQAGRS